MNTYAIFLTTGPSLMINSVDLIDQDGYVTFSGPCGKCDDPNCRAITLARFDKTGVLGWAMLPPRRPVEEPQPEGAAPFITTGRIQ